MIYLRMIFDDNTLNPYTQASYGCRLQAIPVHTGNQVDVAYRRRNRKMIEKILIIKSFQSSKQKNYIYFVLFSKKIYQNVHSISPLWSIQKNIMPIHQLFLTNCKFRVAFSGKVLQSKIKHKSRHFFDRFPKYIEQCKQRIFI